MSVLAAATVLAAACTGSTSPQAKRSLVFDPVRGSIGPVRLGDPMPKLVQLFGKPDRIVPLRGGPAVYFWLRGKAFCTMWAQAYTAKRSSRNTVLIDYLGPLRTSKGDRIGTGVRTVRRHWRGGHYLRTVTGAIGPNYGLVTHYGSTTFAFDQRRRLAGISIQTSEQYWQPVAMKC